LFGGISSKIAIEASVRKRIHQNSIQIKPFNHAPKEVPINIKSIASSSGRGVLEFQMEPAQSEVQIHSPCFEAKSISEGQEKIVFTPRKNLQRQAYVAMKASPNVTANGEPALV
jgi:hypothetical protein